MTDQGAQSELIVTQSFPIPAGAVGFVVGSKGATVKEVQASCGVTISINRDSSNAEAPFRFASIRGTPRNISHAKQKLVMLVFRFGQLSAGAKTNAAPRIHRHSPPPEAEEKKSEKEEAEKSSEEEAAEESEKEEPEKSSEDEAAESEKEEAEKSSEEEAAKEETKEAAPVLAPAPAKRRTMTLAEKRAAAAAKK